MNLIAASETNESEQRRELGELLECIRITSGLSQIEYAAILGVAQSTVSKLEHGELTISTSQWCQLAETLKIPIETVKYGFLDNKTNTTIKHWRTENGYYVPKEYAADRCLKVRALLPFINFMRKHMDPTYFSTKLKEMVSERKGVDCFPRVSFFRNLDDQVGLAFWDEFLQRIRQDLSFTKKTMASISALGASSSSHGYLAKTYQKGKDGISLMRQFMAFAPKYQGLILNTFLESSDDRVALSLQVNPELEESFYERSEMFKNFIETLYTGVFENIPFFSSSRASKASAAPPVIRKQGSLLKDDRKIIYEIQAT